MENYNVNTDFWFPKILTSRITKMLRGKLPQIVQDITIHDDGDKSMVGITFGPDVGDIAATAVKREILYYIIGFVDAHDSLRLGIIPVYNVGHEGRSGYRLDQSNRRMANGFTGNFHNVVNTCPVTRKAVEAALFAAYDGITQFCLLNGIAYPSPQL
jgi:hypothetical protein